MLFIGTVAAWLRDRRRNIFRFHDGSGWRREDPIDVGSRLETECPDYQKILGVLAEDPAQLPPGSIRDALRDQQKSAGRELAALSRKVFGLKTLPEGGLTAGEAINVIASYFLFMEGLARDSAPFATSPGAESPSTPATTTGGSAGSGTAGR